LSSQIVNVEKQGDFTILSKRTDSGQFFHTIVHVYFDISKKAYQRRYFTFLDKDSEDLCVVLRRVSLFPLHSYVNNAKIK